MIKKDYKTEERVVVDKHCVDVHLICDCCGKEIEQHSYYWNVCTGHYDWGNDSVDSVKHYDLCSNECFKKEVDSFLEEGHSTPYVNAETEFYFKRAHMGE